MASAAYRPVFAERAAQFLLKLPKRRQNKALSFVFQLCAHPMVRSDYVVTDDVGRDVHHLMIDDYVFAYWLDHAEKEIRVVEIEDAS